MAVQLNIPYFGFFVNSMNAHYIMKPSQLTALSNEITTGTFITNISLLFNNPMDNIISLKAYPFDIKKLLNRTTQSDEHIHINKAIMNANGYKLGDEYPFIKITDFTINRYFNNFLDYAPYTKIELYLPYIGMVVLDNDMILGENITVEYVPNFTNGEVTAYLTKRVYKAGGGYDTYPIKTVKGTIGFDIAIGGGAERAIANNLLATGLKTAAGIGAGFVVGGAAGGAVAGMTALASSPANLVTSLQQRITKTSDNISTVEGLYGPQDAYLIITRPKIVRATAYNSLKGRPSGISATLSTLSGYTVVDDVHVEGLATATLSEQQAIEQQLKAGVIL